MIDIHSHILPQMDDGAADFGCSLEMLRMAANDGITRIIATPHSKDGISTVVLESINDGVRRLNKIAEEHDINIEAFAGTEWLVEPDIPKLMKDGYGCVLAGSRYILVEFSPWQDPAFYRESIFEIMATGYVPILAHPERYSGVLKHPNTLFRYVQKGGLVQVNATSITGLEGKEVRNLVFRLMKHDLVHFVATDAHGVGRRSPVLSKAYGIVKKKFGADYCEKLFCTNGEKVLRDERITVPEPISFKRRIFGLLKPKDKMVGTKNKT
ncbi:MAG: hypothetical protein PHV32_17435 [Eubacteriales bacterium]|nr:hypothetical protein [Eubacteriales bacterium]